MKLQFNHTITGIFFLLLSFRIIPSGFYVNAQKSSVHFPEIPGWIKNDNIRYYTPLNLYDYINGAAELYLNYDFRELFIAEYTDNNNASFTVEIYLHKSPLVAFGIYSQERPLKGNYLHIGTQGYIELPILNFITGNSYVKIYSYDIDNEEVFLTFASEIAEGLGAHTPLPAILDCFPEISKRENSERFVERHFLGYDFLHSGFITGYLTGDKSFQLFIIEGEDSKDCHDMLSNYFQLCRMSHSELIESHCIVTDPYHGKIELEWETKYIWGSINLEDEDLGAAYLHQIKQCIQTIAYDPL